jgi:hypothetical protein
VGLFNRGAEDKAKGQGQADPNKFSNDAARKDYQAGWQKQKEREQQQQQQKKK